MPDYTISILIPVRTINPYLRQCLDSCLQLDYPFYEIIILPDEIFAGFESPKIKIIPTGPIDPAGKRDMGAAQAKGDILAFLDDDTYPPSGWLKNAAKNFDNLEIAAVGGPAITPKEDSLYQQASGLVFSSWAMGGKYVYRYLPRKIRFVDDYPSCNFLIRKLTFLEIGGFKTTSWPGEDTILCLEITKKLKKKIIYDPRVLVYHHRRNLFSSHLRQIANYALHRGYFVKKFPETSMRLAYFLPSLWVSFLVLGALAWPFWPKFRFFYFGLIILYFIIVLTSSLNKKIKLTYLVFFGIILSHIIYGINFLKGLIINKLEK